MTYIRTFILYFNIFCMLFTVLLDTLYALQIFVSFFKIKKNYKHSPADDYEKYIDSDNLLPVSLLIPAYNEQENIAQNVQSLMKIDYPQLEVIVVNDGSTDNTHQQMITTFDLYKIEYSIRVSIPTKEIRGVYYNAKYPNLIYVDKENGGKSDALNAGINISNYPLFACLDADSRLEKDAILKLGTAFIKNTNTVIAGGTIRIANGSIIEDGEWKGFKIPEKMVERFQIVEYFRSFFAGRVSWGITNSLLIVSGAFGLFKKQVVIECGGYRTNTIGEDMEIVVNVHQKMMEKKKKYSVIFCEDAVCWTQGPMSMKDLRVQRRRWQIGLFDSLMTHKRMTLNPRYKTVGLTSMPYNWLFELFGAPIEVLGYLIIPISMMLGELSWVFFCLYLLLSIALGIILSFGGLILEQVTHKGAMSAEQVIKLALYAILENFGYRQYITLCRVEGMLKYRSLRHQWGKIKRKEFNK